VVEHCSTSVGADTAWDEYQLDKDAEDLARKRARFFRAIFVPSPAEVRYLIHWFLRAVR